MRSLLALFLWAGLSLSAWSADMVGLALEGRYDAMEQQLEAQAAAGPLRTRDQHALCYAYSKIKRYSKLFDCLLRLEENVKKGDRRTRLLGLEDATPAIYLLRAEALIELGQYKEAESESGRVIEWLQRNRGSELDMTINAYAAQALAQAFDGRLDEAAKTVDRIRRIDVSWPNGDYANAKNMALARTGMALKRYQETYELLEKDTTFRYRVFLDNLFSGAAFVGRSNWLWAELPRAFMTAKSQLEIGMVAEAKAGFDKLLQIPQISTNGEIYWMILYDRGRIAAAEGKHPEALEFFRRAIEVIEQQRSTINTEANKIGFVGDKQQVYGKFVDTAYTLGLHGEVLEFVGRAKARAFVDLLAAKKELPINARTSSEGVAAFRDYLEASSEAQLQVPQQFGPAPQTSGLTRGLLSAKARLLQQKAPELASLVSVEPTPAGAVVPMLQGDETMLEYFAAGGFLYAIVLARDVPPKTWRIDAEGLDDDVREFRRRIEAVAPNYRELSEKLYQRLIKPVAGAVKGKRLLIVPHGILHYLPFAALHDGSRFLVQQHELRLLPSLQVGRYLSARNPGHRRALVFGNPDLNNPIYDLPAAESESRRLVAAFSDSRLLTRKEATESALRRLAPEYAYIHIASHGEFVAENALKSRLLLAPDGTNDGSLTVDEIYGLSLNASLVVLSACETGLGKVSNGDDVIGLTRGFIYAGSSAVIASLWKVDDDSTAEIMLLFYQSMSKGASIPQALSKAQRDFLQVRDHPFFWAAFFMTGRGA